jgi:hypothetical protein
VAGLPEEGEPMKYKVRATYTYPVDAVDAKDALSTLPQVIKMKYIGVSVEGKAEIINVSTQKVVLKAVLNPDNRKDKQIKEVSDET